MDEEVKNEKKYEISENKVIRTIVMGSDWQEVLVTLVGEEGLDPANIDIVQLAGSFKTYLERLTKFDFKIPARFILVAAILLRMKAEQLLDEEERKEREKMDQIPQINIENIPVLHAPVVRKTTRKVTLDELIGALNKAFEFKDKKEGKTLRMRKAVEHLIEKEEDIEIKIERIFKEIYDKKQIKFSELVPKWAPRQIVDVFLPMLYLSNRGKINCEQEEMFKEIYITLSEKKQEVPTE